MLGTTDHGYEVLGRSELPLGTVELARCLIGRSWCGRPLMAS